MSHQMKAGPTTKAKTFSFGKQLYILPDMEAGELAKVQPDGLMAKLKACNSRLPPPTANVGFVSVAFHIMLRRFKGFLTDAEWRQNKYQWKESIRPYKAGTNKKQKQQKKQMMKEQKSSTPGIEQSAPTTDQITIAIDHQKWWISKHYKRDGRDIGFKSFGAKFIMMNQDHRRQDFTPLVLKQAFNAYVTRCPNMSSEIRQVVMKRKNSKRALKFLNECARLAAEAQARAETKAAKCSADSSSSDSETETDGAGTQDANDSSVEDTDDDMPSVVPAADISAASESTGSEAEVRNTVQSSSEEDQDSSSTTTSSDSEVETPEVVDESHKEMSEGSSDDSDYDKVSIDEDRQDNTPVPRKRRRKSTSPPSTHDVLGSHHPHPPGAKRLRVAGSPILGSSSPSTEQYGPGRDIFSALEEYLNICSNSYKLASASIG